MSSLEDLEEKLLQKKCTRTGVQCSVEAVLFVVVAVEIFQTEPWDSFEIQSALGPVGC